MIDRLNWWLLEAVRWWAKVEFMVAITVLAIEAVLVCLIVILATIAILLAHMQGLTLQQTWHEFMNLR